MPSPITVKINATEFNRALRKDVEHSKRAAADIVNGHAWAISVRALNNTPKVSRATIASDLRKLFAGKHVKKVMVTRYSRFGFAQQAPLVALLINAKRGAGGKPGLYGEKMKIAINRFVGRRFSSIAFLKSGWIPAIKILGPLVRGKPSGLRPDREAKQLGKPKGGATPAREGMRARALIENRASSTTDEKHALMIYGAPALQKAFDEEAAHMLEHITKRFAEAAHAAGIKTG